MDDLDVKILRALMSEGAVAPSDTQVNSSLRSIAARLGADDTTVSYRYKRLQESGAMSGWRLIVNPTFFGCRVMDATVDVEPESAKPDMIRKLKLIGEVTGMIDFYGRALKLIVVYNGEESRSRTIELISRQMQPLLTRLMVLCRVRPTSHVKCSLASSFTSEAGRTTTKPGGSILVPPGLSSTALYKHRPSVLGQGSFKLANWVATGI